MSAGRLTLNRRLCLQGLTASAILAGQKRLLPAEEDFSSLYVEDDVDRAVSEGVDFLVQSRRNDGAITDRGHEIAMTSLAIMAMASIGIEPGEPNERGLVMKEAIDFVLRDGHQDSKGYYGGRDGSRMYGHGITTLMLTEMLGMGATPEQNQKIHESLEKAINLILDAQSVPKSANLAGGWRYQPGSPDSDLSVSVWQLMALRSAKNDGLDVPAKAIEKALEYLRNSYASPRDRNGQPRDKISGFSYTPSHHHPTFTMTAAGLLAMQVCGQYDSPLVSGAAQWLLQNPPKSSVRFFHYGIYYYAQGMHQAGGKYAKEADELVSGVLLDSQRSNGSWLARGGEERNVGAVYSTAMSILSLSVRYHYLPIYQR